MIDFHMGTSFRMRKPMNTLSAITPIVSEAAYYPDYRRFAGVVVVQYADYVQYLPQDDASGIPS